MIEMLYVIRNGQIIVEMCGKTSGKKFNIWYGIAKQE